ncbi:hypothetical protein BJV82DRAFT_674445 [Fennellomyces sp. T-0311]|nr:hypothetical protein BJV82DRAFT_674445 [Fennellomyces sp. T-0311]
MAQLKKYARIYLQVKTRTNHKLKVQYDELIKLLEEYLTEDIIEQYKDAFFRLKQGESESPPALVEEEEFKLPQQKYTSLGYGSNGEYDEYFELERNEYEEDETDESDDEEFYQTETEELFPARELRPRNDSDPVPITIEVLPDCPVDLIVGNNWLSKARARIGYESKEL